MRARDEPDAARRDRQRRRRCRRGGLRVRTRRSGGGHGHEEERHCNEAERGAEASSAITVKVTVAVCSPARPAGSGDENPKPGGQTSPARGTRGDAAFPTARSLAGGTGIGASAPPESADADLRRAGCRRPRWRAAGRPARRPSDGRSTSSPAASLLTTVTCSASGAGLLPGSDLAEAQRRLVERDRQRRLDVEVHRHALAVAATRRCRPRTRPSGRRRIARSRAPPRRSRLALESVSMQPLPARTAAVAAVEAGRRLGALEVGSRPVPDEVGDERALRATPCRGAARELGRRHARGPPSRPTPPGSWCRWRRPWAEPPPTAAVEASETR